VDFKVYDLTAWLPQHPGGGAIVVGMCGADGAVIFRDHHHAEQDSAISLYYLGDLK
jgi:cytochrome b involved in lipid metabolism